MEHGNAGDVWNVGHHFLSPFLDDNMAQSYDTHMKNMKRFESEQVNESGPAQNDGEPKWQVKIRRTLGHTRFKRFAPATRTTATATRPTSTATKLTATKTKSTKTTITRTRKTAARITATATRTTATATRPTVTATRTATTPTRTTAPRATTTVTSNNVTKNVINTLIRAITSTIVTETATIAAANDIGATASENVTVATASENFTVATASENVTVTTASENAIVTPVTRDTDEYATMKPEIADDPMTDGPNDSAPLVNIPVQDTAVTTTNGNKPIYFCKFCQIPYGTKMGLTRHINDQHQETKKLYGCPICPAVFTFKKDLKVHEPTHRDEEPLPCTSGTNDKSFSSNASLQAPQLIHTDRMRLREPYVCNICNAAFNRSYKLTKHLKVHNGCKPFFCNFCTKSYTRLDGLLAHQRTHLADWQYGFNLGIRQQGHYILSRGNGDNKLS